MRTRSATPRAAAPVIRPLRETDLNALTKLVRALLPTMVVTAASLDHVRRWTHWWVAEEAGEIVGAARAGRGGRAWVGVDASARRSGIGAELLERVEDRLRSTGELAAEGWSDDDAGAGFAAARGYRRAREKPVSVRLLAGDVELPPLELPHGVALHPLRDVSDRLPELHRLAVLCYADEPTGSPPGEQMPFDRWLEEDLGVPTIDPVGSVVAEVDGRLVAYGIVLTDGAGRAENDFTGTHPDYRNRGLARLVKLASLHWARANGVREIWTGNDAENAPMLAVNRRLGYTVTHARAKHVRAL